jgi:hypothetical protein
MNPLPSIIESSDQVGAVATLSDGRLAMFFTGPHQRETISHEHPEQPIYMRISADNGQTWSETRQVFAFPAGKGIVSAATPLVDQEGNLHLFTLRFYQLGWENGAWHSALFHIRSEDNGESWSEPLEIDFGARYTGSLNSALLLESGRILVPFSYLNQESDSGMFVSRVVYSDDGGRTWAYSNDCTVNTGGRFLESGAVEPVVVQLNSGLVWMIIRTTVGYFWESFSNDGVVWTPPRQTRIVSSNAPAGVLRLRDGRLALFWNNCYGDPMREGVSYARQVLSGAISRDDGQTWSTPKAVACRYPDQPIRAQTTYPFLCEAPDGVIVLMYHRIYAEEGRDWMHPIRELVRVEPEWLESPK